MYTTSWLSTPHLGPVGSDGPQRGIDSATIRKHFLYSAPVTLRETESQIPGRYPDVPG